MKVFPKNLALKSVCACDDFESKLQLAYEKSKDTETGKEKPVEHDPKFPELP